MSSKKTFHADLSTALLLIYFTFIRAFNSPVSVSSDVALNSNVTASNMCTTCSKPCLYRDAFPSESTVLKTRDVNCALHTFNVLPQRVNGSNGQVLFNESSSVACPSVTLTGSRDSNNSFTLSVWVSVKCENCTVLKIGSVELMFNGSMLFLKVSGVSKPSGFTHSNWQHVVIRFNGHVTFFVDVHEQVLEEVTSIDSFTELSIGPGTNLTENETIAVADARWYADVLTDREITMLRNGTWQSIPHTSCRCPATAPSLVQNSKPEDDMYCTNKAVTTASKVSRLNPESNLPIFMIDNDTQTSWKSGTTNDVTIDLTLTTVYQIKGLKIMGVSNISVMDTLKITLTGATNSKSTWLFKKSSDDKCTNISKTISSDMFSYDFETGINTRENVSSLAAKKIGLYMHRASPAFFTVSEIKVIARCHCFGNDKNCSIGSDGVYKCHCDANSRTEGEHCDTCMNKYFRYESETLCNKTCQCNTTGSTSETCEQVGGQCECNSNVAGRQCTGCKHNSVNFSTGGCTACSCNQSGIVQCNPNMTCTCKANVEQDSGFCKECLPDYYGLDYTDGCKACKCDIRGSSYSQCNRANGKCPCKHNVEGTHCDECKPGYHDLSTGWSTLGCIVCECHFVGSISTVCNNVTGRCNCFDKRATREKDKSCKPLDLTLNPNHGPLAGGTRITVNGYSLGGDNVTITFRINGTKQIIESSNDSMIVIRTNASKYAEEMPITLEWRRKGDTESYRDQSFEDNTKFTFMTNPTIVSDPKTLKTYANGGCSVRVEGTHLDSVPEPQFIVHTGQESLQTICIHDSNDWMTCKTPNVSQYSSRTNLSYVYRLDNVTINENRAGADLEIVSNPVIKNKANWEFRNTFDKEIEITGDHLNEACDDADVSILVGDKICRLLRREDKSMSCEPDETFPGETRDKVSVVVQIGNTQIKTGEIKFIQFWQTKEFMYIAIGVSLFVILVIVLALVICVCWRRRKHEDIHKPTDNMELFERPHARNNDYTSMANPVGTVSPINVHPTRRDSKEITLDFTSRLQRQVSKVVKSSCIERSQIHIGKTCTYKGTKIRIINGQFAKSTSSPFSGKNLTIKTLVERYPETGTIPTWLSDGLVESTRFRDFTDANVLRLLGLAVDEKQIYVIYPEMSKRTLKDYLQFATEPYTEELRLSMCVEVAEGMNYLDVQHIVHKDLAARNCWVNSDDQVKIADASFTHDIYPDEYLYQNSRYQPVRWMAPESLKQSGFYHCKSDVWSFGVLMWEVFTNGFLPYHDIEDNRQIQKCVCEDGYRLGQPQDCSTDIFAVIEACHSERGEDRPNFFLILNLLQNVISPGDDTPISYVNEVDLQEDYMNINTLNASASGGENGLENYVNFTFNKPRPAKRH